MQTRKEPYGVVGLITPWNYPLLMSLWKVGPSLAAGNCVILKPSELTPLTNIFLGSLVIKAGFPPGVVNILVGYGTVVGRYISKHPKIPKISFTGSTRVGREIMQNSGESNLKKVGLELGGKSPVIVFKDCILDVAVAEVWQAGYSNMSQNCVAGTRIYIAEEIF